VWFVAGLRHGGSQESGSRQEAAAQGT